MHELPRQKLSELLAQHGVNLCDDAKKLEGLLKDVLRNEYKRETFALISALREGVVHELRGSKSKMPPAALAEKLTRHLCDNLGLDDAVARWSVESWALALGVEITQPLVAPIKKITKLPSTQPTPVSSPPTPVSSPQVDLAAIVLQHREKAREEELKAEQDRLKAARAAAIAAQRQREADLLAAEMARKAKSTAVPVQKEAKRLAEQTRDFAAAARMLEEIDPQWRDAKLYEAICGYRDKVIQLDAAIQNAVHKGQLLFLRSRVQELLKLQPKRDDMRRLLEVLPDEPELAREFTNSIGMKFVLIEPGNFTMGSKNAGNEMPPHVVAITQPFYLGACPVTQQEYVAVADRNPSLFRGKSQHPVERVDWNDAVKFCVQLNQLQEIQRGARYRLPTEAEWEYACRADSTTKWCFGDNESLLNEYAWYDKNSDRQTHPVGKKTANNWGIYDMHGNVLEWCQDGYLCGYTKHSNEIATDPIGSGSHRVCRGGSWRTYASSCRSACREYFDAGFRDDYLGFRVAMSLPVHY